LEAFEVEVSELLFLETEVEVDTWVYRSTWSASWRARAERESKLHTLGAADDLLEYQATSQGGWVMVDEAGCAV
jgi:hypothetical protein